jgi:hypothetical protein
MMTRIWLAVACAAAATAQAQHTEGKAGMDYAEFSVSRLTCIIGNNASLGEHKARYNGVFSMSSPDQSETPYVPFYAGINLENFFDQRPRHEDGDVFFEPRAQHIDFKKVNDTTADLYQPPTPYFGIESKIRFELKEPYYIDVDYTCIPHKADLKGGFFGVFWASYINAPINKSIYFLGKGSTLDEPFWEQYVTHKHDRDSTVKSQDDPFDPLFDPGPTVLWNQISLLQYGSSFYYGRFRNMVLIYIFKPNPQVRFSHSPSGGGKSKDGSQANPAWDFQLVVPDYEVNKEYGFEMRAVYKVWEGRDDVIAEVRKFLDE